MAGNLIIHQIVPSDVPSYRRRKQLTARKVKRPAFQLFSSTAEALLTPTATPAIALATFITQSSDKRRLARQTEKLDAPSPTVDHSTFDHLELQDDTYYDNQDEPLPLIDLLERRVAAEAAKKPQHRRYLASVSNIYFVLTCVDVQTTT